MIHTELLCLFTPSRTPESSDISKLVNIYVEAVPLVSTLRYDFFSSEGGICKNGITTFRVISC